MNIGILVVLKYVNFGIYTIDGIAQLFGSSKTLIKSVDFLIPLGVSFYTFSLLGYVIDVYNGIAKPQRNYWKLMLYGMYFPVILSGPILKYREHGEQFFVPHRFDYRLVTRGMQRMLTNVTYCFPFFLPNFSFQDLFRSVKRGDRRTGKNTYSFIHTPSVICHLRQWLGLDWIEVMIAGLSLLLLLAVSLLQQKGSVRDKIGGGAFAAFYLSMLSSAMDTMTKILS